MSNQFRTILPCLLLFYFWLSACKKDSNVLGISITKIDNITKTSASCTSSVIIKDTLSIITGGICWSESPLPTINNSKTIDSSRTVLSTSLLTGLNEYTLYFARAYVITKEGVFYSDQFLFQTSKYDLGQEFGGGIVAYIDGSGLHGLIIIPHRNQSFWAKWYDDPSPPFIGTTDGIGSGKSNTEKIVAYNNSNYNAATICDTLTINGFDDWFIPSLDEFLAIDKNRTMLGPEYSYPYVFNNVWTSTEYSGLQYVESWILWTDTPNHVHIYPKQYAQWVFPIRYF